MKRLVILFVLFISAIISFGQSVVDKKTSVNRYLDLDKQQTYFWRAAPTTDAIADSDSLWQYTIGVDNLYDANKQYVKQTLDKLTGTPNTDITLKGKVFWDDAWTTITTIHWAGSADSTIIFDQSTAKHYRFYMIQHLGRAGTFTYEIDKTEVQFYK